MKKIFKALAISVASLAMVAGIATATACSGGYNGVYEGEYHYPNAWKPEATHYGMCVRVTVENNIITRVVDTTKGKYVSVSEGWADKETWTKNENLLLMKYEGYSVADILAIKVYVDEKGQPYSRDDNTAMSELLITDATQGSARLLLAVQNALGKTIEPSRIEKAE